MKEKVSENKNMPLLGIIVPVYNTEKYVKECFDSLFNQAYKNIHVIIVDDCSPGNIKDIFDYYQSIHPNMTLVRNETNKGLFLARVEGIKKALSLETVPDYIAFLDSDDYVSTGIYDSLIQNALTNESDIVSGEHIEVHQDYSLKFNSLLYENDYLLDSKGLLDNLFKQHYYDFSWWIVWNKIYKTDVIKNSLSDLEIVDKHLVMTEDVLFSTIFFSNCSKFTNSRTGDFFYYRKTGEDQSTNVNSSSVEKFKKAIDDIEYSFNTANTVLEKHNLASEYSHDCVYTKNLLFKQYKKLVLNTNLSKINKKKVLDFIDSKIDLDVDFKNYQLVNFATTPNFDFNDEKAIQELKHNLTEYFNKTNNQYYLLYCRDSHYFTLFNKIHSTIDCSNIIDCIRNAGDLIFIDFDNIEAPEIWIRINDEVYVMYLIPYDNGLVEL